MTGSQSMLEKKNSDLFETVSKMASALNSELSNEDWLVMRARSCFRHDPYAAKAWMLTARTLFPKNFNIQFEAYNLEKMGKHTKEAAKLLEGLYMSFPDESRLWSEVHSILEALQNDTGDKSNAFLTEILAAVPTQVQCQMLLSVSEKITDKLEQCRLLLLAMRKFPDLIKEHGLKLVETLLTAEDMAQFQSPVNCYRKLLICDVLPLILQKSQQTKQLKTYAKNLYIWLQKSVEFYISFLTQAPSQEPTTPLSPDLLSPTKKCRRLTIPGLQDKECQVSDPWGSLYKLLVLIGQNLGWDMEADFFTKSREYQWQYILSLYNRSTKPGVDAHNQQILCTTAVLFLECLYHYVSSVDPEVFHTGSSSPPLVLIEGFKMEQTNLSSQPPTKRLKAESLLPHVNATDSVPNSQKVIQNFLTAFKCYELLHSTKDLQREFMILCNNWRMETWSWMGHFQTDMFLYQGAFQEVVRHLQNFPGVGSKGKLQIRHSLQLACCFYCLNNFSKACELALDVIAALPVSSPQTDSVETTNQSKFIYGSGRNLVLVPCTESEILPYCIQLLLTCFKEKAFGSKSSDSHLGYTMVLLQYDWPTHEGLFHEIVKKIQKQGSFSFNVFFNYIINVDVLEEFAFMKTAEGGKVNLDILPISTSAIAQQRTVTRGVNKGVTEDFKVMMEKQVRRSEEGAEAVVRQFLTCERTTLLSTLV